MEKFANIEKKKKTTISTIWRFIHKFSLEYMLPSEYESELRFCLVNLIY